MGPPFAISEGSYLHRAERWYWLFAISAVWPSRESGFKRRSQQSVSNAYEFSRAKHMKL